MKKKGTLSDFLPSPSSPLLSSKARYDSPEKKGRIEEGEKMMFGREEEGINPNRKGRGRG